MNLQQVYDFLGHGGLVSLATIEGDQPRVRVVSLMARDDQYWFCTFLSRDKIRQLRENDKFEFFFGVKVGDSWGSIRASGRAVIVDDGDIESEMMKDVPFFNDHLDPQENHECGLVRLDVEEIRAQSPYDGKHYRFDLRRR